MRKAFSGNHPITRPFGVYDPAYHNYPGSKHPGTDYSMPTGTQLVANQSGTATIYNRDAAIKTGRGKEVVITYANKITKTCHMSRIDVKTGQRVTEGQAIGLSGNTGYSTGPHLHNELLVNGVYTDLEVYLKQEGIENMYNGQTAEYWYDKAEDRAKVIATQKQLIANRDAEIDKLNEKIANRDKIIVELQKGFQEVGIIDGQKIYRKVI